MKKSICLILILGFMGSLMACAGGRGRVGVYHGYGYGSRWGHHPHYRNRVIVVPGDRYPEYEATPLPSGPGHMPDMGMPDLDMDTMDMDFYD